MSFSSVLPSPTAGWNARDSLESMKPEDAIILDNIFPASDRIKLRKGTALHATGAGAGKNFRTLMSYNAMDGTSKMLGVANQNMYLVSSGSLTSLTTGLSSNDWQYVNFGSKLIMVSGNDTPRQYDGSTVTTISYTGPSDTSKLSNVGIYKDRLYFCESGTASFWYAGNQAISGVLTEFDLQYQLKLGGSLMFVGGVTRDTGAGIQDVFAVCSSKGELILYTGLNPSDSSWSKVGHFLLSRPLGPRAFSNIRNELYILTLDGIVPVSALLGGSPVRSASNAITDRIRNAYTDSTKKYGDNFGWSMHSYPAGDYVFVNVPVSNNTTSHQYVMNIITGAWARFTNMNAQSWVLHEDSLYYGGADGTVFKADSSNSDTSSDSTGTAIGIPATVKWAFNYFKDRARTKLYTMIAPLIIGDSNISFDVSVDTDFSSNAFSPSLTIVGNEGSPWDTSAWDVSPWDTTELYKEVWFDISAEGRNMSLSLSGIFKDAPFSLSAVKVVYEKGGVI